MHPVVAVIAPFVVVVQAVAVVVLPLHTVLLGMADGAVYRPLVEIVPHVEFPPVTPFTCQVTVVSVAPVTVTANCAVPCNATVVAVGPTATRMVVLLLWHAPASPANRAIRTAKPHLLHRSFKSRISPIPIVSFASPAGPAEGRMAFFPLLQDLRPSPAQPPPAKIGRASCRERV